MSSVSAITIGCNIDLVHADSILEFSHFQRSTITLGATNKSLDMACGRNEARTFYSVSSALEYQTAWCYIRWRRTTSINDYCSEGWRNMSNRKATIARRQFRLMILNNAIIRVLMTAVVSAVTFR